MKKTLLTLILLTSASLFANEIQCKENGNQMEMNQCAYEAFKKADKELNKVYQEVRAKHKADKLFLTNLKASQKIWLKFLDAELETSYSCAEKHPRVCFGSMFPLLYNESKTKLTKERTEQLRRHLKNPLL